MFWIAGDSAIAFAAAGRLWAARHRSTKTPQRPSRP